MAVAPSLNNPIASSLLPPAPLNLAIPAAPAAATPIPAAPAAPTSIGAYKGVPITAGSQSDIAAQMAKIDAATASTAAPVIPVSSLTGAAPTPITPVSPPAPAPVPKPVALTETPAESNESEIISELQGLDTQEAGKAAATTAANTAAGVDQIQQAINDNNLAIKQLNDSASAASLNQDNRQAPEFAITGSQAEIERNRSVQALGLSSISDALANNLTAAQAKAAQAIAAQYGPIEASIAAYTQNLQLIQQDPETSIEDKNRAQEASEQLDAYTASIAQAKTEAATILSTAQTAATFAKNFTPTSNYSTLSQALSAIASAATPTDATQIAEAAGLVQSTNKSQIIGSADTGYFNVVTDSNGKVISSTPVSGSGGGSTNAPTVQSGNLVITQADIQQGAAGLKASASQGSEADGKYADPNVYLQMYERWVQEGGKAADFFKYYPYATYINPANTWLAQSITNYNNSGSGGGDQNP